MVLHSSSSSLYVRPFAVAVAWLGFFLLPLITSSSQAQQSEAHDLLLQQQLSFADVLTNHLYKNPNECTSSLGISMCFSLIYPSSTGETQTELQDVFGYSPLTTTTTVSQDQPQLAWTDWTLRLTGQYQGECLGSGGGGNGECYGSNAPLLQIANRVWVRDSVTLNATYAAILKDYVQQLDFEQENAGEIINSWVQDTTNGLIDSIVDDGPLDPLWVLLAVNSLYLKASWARQFSNQRTNEDLFYTSPLRTTAVDSKARFMHVVDKFFYSDTALPGYQLLRLAFAGTDTLSMVFVLPLADGNPAVAATQLVPALNDLISTKVAVALPKFRFESEYSGSLLKALEASGLVAPFTGGLCVEQDSCDAFVDYVIQKTVMDVNELGMEAAAMTAVAGGRNRPTEEEVKPVLFLANHPFQFFVVHDDAEAEASAPLILFEGRVGSPAVGQGAPAVLFTALHSDADFWLSNFGVEPVVVEPVVVKKSDATTPENQNQETTDTTTEKQKQEETTTEKQNLNVKSTEVQNQDATTTAGCQDPKTKNKQQNGVLTDETSQSKVSTAADTHGSVLVAMILGLVMPALFQVIEW